jgi:hypothetical protein
MILVYTMCDARLRRSKDVYIYFVWQVGFLTQILTHIKIRRTALCRDAFVFCYRHVEDAAYPGQQQEYWS